MQGREHTDQIQDGGLVLSGSEFEEFTTNHQFLLYRHVCRWANERCTCRTRTDHGDTAVHAPGTYGVPTSGHGTTNHQFDCSIKLFQIQLKRSAMARFELAGEFQLKLFKMGDYIYTGPVLVVVAYKT